MVATVEKQEVKRKEEELNTLLGELKQNGEDCASKRNRARSLTQIDLELGRYREKPPKWVPSKSLNFREWSPEKSKEFAIETRRDGLHTRHNTDTILKRLKTLEKAQGSLARLEFEIMACLAILAFIGLKLVFDFKIPGLG